MMQTVLANLLLTHQPLKTLVANRIHWDEMPQGLPLPNIVMSVVSGDLSYTMGGPSGLAFTRVQFDCRGNTAAVARAVAEALRAKLSGYSGEFAGVEFQGCFERMQRTGGGGAAASKWFNDSRDYTIHWALA